MSKIEWTDLTWNATRGCSRVSSGCDNCYAMRQARRQDRPGGAYEGLTRIGKHGVDWSGNARLVPSQLDLPLRWKTPKRIFVDSMSDLFHESLSNEEIAAVFGVMTAARQHTFQVLTKRVERASEWFEWLSDECLDPERDPPPGVVCGIYAANYGADIDYLGIGASWPRPNIWIGASTEDQETYDDRRGFLQACPAAVRFLSLEPLLGPINLASGDPGEERRLMIDWVIAGGESGHGARPMHPCWARSIADQCLGARIPFFFKQWGSWKPLMGERPRRGDLWVFPKGGFEAWDPSRHANIAGTARAYGEPSPIIMRRLGKKSDNRKLDGQLFEAFPT